MDENNNDIRAKTREYKKSIKYYTNAIELEPSNAEYYNSRSLYYYLLREYEMAIEDYTKAILLEPSNAEYYNNRGDCYYYGLNEYEKAIEDYTKAIQFEPSNAECYKSRGDCYYWLDEYEKAIEDYAKAIQLKPSNAESYNSIGHCYSGLKEYEKAIENYTKAIQLESAKDASYTGRGCCYYWLKEYKKSLADFNKAIELNPQNESYYYDTIKRCKDKILENEDLLDKKIDNDSDNKESDTINVVKKIEIASCSKQELQLTNCFDDIKINKFLKLRENGKMWYNIESFASEFNLQPHEMIQLENCLIFPAKPNSKHGRIVEF